MRAHECLEYSSRHLHLICLSIDPLPWARNKKDERFISVVFFLGGGTYQGIWA